MNYPHFLNERMLQNSSVQSNEKGKTVVGRKLAIEEKAVASLRNHSEAERRRRARINGHLATLRALIPGTSKMDKASLLAKVISHLKELKKHVVETTRGLVIPFDADEVRVEESKESSNGATICIRASVCCDYRSEILSDLRQALDSLQLKMTEAHIATLEGRMKIFLVLTGEEAEYPEVPKHHPGSVLLTLKSVLDKYSASQELLSRDFLSNKRRRITSIFDMPMATSNAAELSSSLF